MVTILSYLVIIFGYMALLALIMGTAYRIWNWKRLPAGFSWGLFPKPTKWTVTSVLWKVLFWPTLFKTDKLLWTIAMCFHIGILVLFVGHLGNFVDMLSVTEKLGIPSQAAYEVGIYAGTLAAIALLLFVFRRIFASKTQQISSFADHFWLWFLLFVVAVGIYARLFDDVSSAVAREFALSIITFKPILPPDNFWFVIHILLAEIFIIYSITGKPMHFVGQWFTQYIVVYEKR